MEESMPSLVRPTAADFVNALRKSGLSYREISDMTGISVTTLRSLVNLPTIVPRRMTYDTLEDAVRCRHRDIIEITRMMCEISGEQVSEEEN